MIIDEDILKDGIDEVLLAKLIDKHSLEQERYEKLYNYYIGKHAICERRRSSDNIANNKIVDVYKRQRPYFFPFFTLK